MQLFSIRKSKIKILQETKTRQHLSNSIPKGGDTCYTPGISLAVSEQALTMKNDYILPYELRKRNKLAKSLKENYIKNSCFMKYIFIYILF